MVAPCAHTHTCRNEQRSAKCSGHFPLLVSEPSSSRTHTKNPWRLVTSCDLGGALLGEARASGVRFPAHASPTSACLEGRGLRGICSRVLSGCRRCWEEGAARPAPEAPPRPIPALPARGPGASEAAGRGWAARCRMDRGSSGPRAAAAARRGQASPRRDCWTGCTRSPRAPCSKWRRW